MTVGSIFRSFTPRAKLIWEKPSALYDNASQLAIQKAIDNRIGDSILPFAYPPVTALVLMPLGWLSFRMAFVAITLVNIGAAIGVHAQAVNPQARSQKRTIDMVATQHVLQFRCP